MSKQAFTLIELLFAIAIAVILAGMAAGGIMVIRKQAMRQATRQMVQSIALAAATYPALWHVNGTATDVVTWDWNQDGILDGLPSGEVATGAYPATIKAELESSGYRGFAAVTGLEIPRWAHDRQSGRIIDPWKHPIRIAIAAKMYDDGLYGVWSVGPDGVSDNEDDLRSWGH